MLDIGLTKHVEKPICHRAGLDLIFFIRSQVLWSMLILVNLVKTRIAIHQCDLNHPNILSDKLQNVSTASYCYYCFFRSF